MPQPKKPRKSQKNGLPHFSKPDTDNLIKTYLDALNKIAWRDDSLVYTVHAIKLWSDNPRTIIEIIPFDQKDTGVI